MKKLLVLGSLLPVSLLSQIEEKPNVVIVFCDDMGYGDLGATGATGYITPNIDHMCAQGMRFTNFYAGQAVSSASRAALLTGCYPNRIGIEGALRPWHMYGLNPNEMTIAEVVKQKGYKTAAIGKWHVGTPKEFLPLQHGFDEYLGLPYSNDMWPYDYQFKPVKEGTAKGKYPPLPLLDGNEVVTYIESQNDQSKLTTRYTERTVAFIKENRKNPFLLYLAHSMPHVPLAVSDKFKGKSKAGMYGDVIMEIDWSLGEIFKALKDNGIERKTLVIFASDNGPWLNFGNWGGSTAGLREGKGTAFEGGQRVPCVMFWDGVIPKGSVCNELSSTIDILPTIAQLIGAKLPDHKIDGVNILPLLQGGSESPRKYFAYYYTPTELRAVRNDRFKLVFPHKSRSYANLPAYDGEPGKTTNMQIEIGLYDLRRDPGERYDVQAQFPEVVKELSAIAEEFRDDLGDSLTQRKGKNVRAAGSLDKN